MNVEDRIRYLFELAAPEIRVRVYVGCFGTYTLDSLLETYRGAQPGMQVWIARRVEEAIALRKRQRDTPPPTGGGGWFMD